MSLTSPHFANTVRITPSGISGWRFVILMRLVPIPTNSICTRDNSPLSCRNSDCPFVERRTVFFRPQSTKFVARLFAPFARHVPEGVMVIIPFMALEFQDAQAFWGRIRRHWYSDDHSCFCPFHSSGLPHCDTTRVNTALNLYCTDSLRFSCVPAAQPYRTTIRSWLEST